MGKFVVGGECEKEAGNSYREASNECQVARQERERKRQKSGSKGEQHRIDGLGQEEVGNPLDVVDHPPAFVHNFGQNGEGAVKQHSLRDGTRGGRT